MELSSAQKTYSYVVGFNYSSSTPSFRKLIFISKNLSKCRTDLTDGNIANENGL